MSADALNKVTVEDDAWVVERSEDKELIEKQKAIEELEMVKQARLDSLTVIENMELERPSSRLTITCFYNHLFDHCFIVTIFQDGRTKKIRSTKRIRGN